MDVEIPISVDPHERTRLLQSEKEYSQRLQNEGKWVHIWRIVGAYSNLSIFEVEDNSELHELLWNLPLFPFMHIHVTPLAPHPSSVRDA
jgi:muconolactone D-isomerase